jgi:hypothetical protein
MEVLAGKAYYQQMTHYYSSIFIMFHNEHTKSRSYLDRRTFWTGITQIYITKNEPVLLQLHVPKISCFTLADLYVNCRQL